MLIEYKTTRSVREVSEAAGNRLIRMRIARPVYPDKMLRPEQIETPVLPKIEAKRKYKRRDMQAEG